MNDWQDDFDLTIQAYNQDRWEEGAAACERLLNHPALPPDIEYHVRRNATWYARPLAPDVVGSWDIPNAWGHAYLNPSIAAAEDEGHFGMILRAVNYHIHPGGRYEIFDDHQVIRTRNSLVKLRVDPWDQAWEFSQPKLIIDNWPMGEPQFPVVGLEDLRLSRDGDTWRVVGTSRDNPHGVCVQMTADLGNDGVITRLDQVSWGHQHDKNWMPLVSASGEHQGLIERMYPVTVHLRWGETPHIVGYAPWQARHWRGGSQAIWTPELHGWLCLVHEAVEFPESPETWRVYTHRWVLLDRKWNVSQASRPFTFEHRGIEFAAGLARWQDCLLVSYGVDDREARLASVPLSKCADSLIPVQELGRVRVGPDAFLPGSAEEGRFLEAMGIGRGFPLQQVHAIAPQNLGRGNAENVMESYG